MEIEIRVKSNFNGNISFCAGQIPSDKDEDRFYTKLSTDSTEPSSKLNISSFSIFDGHGGKFASTYCADKLHDNIYETCQNMMLHREESDLTTVLCDAIRTRIAEVDEVVRQQSLSGTTAVSIFVIPLSDGSHRVVTPWIGDSSCCMFQVRDGKQLSMMVTEDHRPDIARERQRIESRKDITQRTLPIEITEADIMKRRKISRIISDSNRSHDNVSNNMNSLRNRSQIIVPSIRSVRDALNPIKKLSTKGESNSFDLLDNQRQSLTLKNPFTKQYSTPKIPELTLQSSDVIDSSAKMPSFQRNPSEGVYDGKYSEKFSENSGKSIKRITATPILPHHRHIHTNVLDAVVPFEGVKSATDSDETKQLEHRKIIFRPPYDTFTPKSRGDRETYIERRQSDGPLAVFNKSGVSLMMTRSIGDNNGPKSCVAVPDITATTIPPNTHARFVMASDGLWDVMKLDDIRRIVSPIQDAKETTIRLIRRAHELRRSREIHMDDITVLVVDINYSLFQPIQPFSIPVLDSCGCLIS